MTIEIATTIMLSGKGIKPGTHTDTRYIWKVTREPLQKINDKKIRYEIAATN